MILRVNKHLFLYSLSIVCLSTLFGCNGTVFKTKTQTTDTSSLAATPPTSSLVTNPQAQQPISSYSGNKEYLSTKSTVPVIPLAVSQEEIAMREEQVKIAQEQKRAAERRSKAGVGSDEEERMAEYFVLSNKIRLLQAKQLLQLKQQQEKNKNSLNKI